MRENKDRESRCCRWLLKGFPLRFVVLHFEVHSSCSLALFFLFFGTDERNIRLCAMAKCVQLSVRASLPLRVSIYKQEQEQQPPYIYIQEEGEEKKRGKQSDAERESEKSFQFPLSQPTPTPLQRERDYSAFFRGSPFAFSQFVMDNPHSYIYTLFRSSLYTQPLVRPLLLFCPPRRQRERVRKLSVPIWKQGMFRRRNVEQLAGKKKIYYSLSIRQMLIQSRGKTKSNARLSTPAADVPTPT